MFLFVLVYSLVHTKIGWAGTDRVLDFEIPPPPHGYVPPKILFEKDVGLIPSDLEEALDFLDQKLTKEEKEEWKEVIYLKSQHPNELPEDKDIRLKVIKYGEFGIGHWISSSWLWRKTRLARWFHWRGIYREPQMSEIIRSNYELRLEGKKPTFNEDWIWRWITFCARLSLKYWIWIIGTFYGYLTFHKLTKLAYNKSVE